MTGPAQDDARAAAAILRRLATSHHAGEISMQAYRRDRRRVLEALSDGRPLPDDLVATSLVDEVRWRLAVIIALAALAALAVVWVIVG